MKFAQAIRRELMDTRAFVGDSPGYFGIGLHQGRRMERLHSIPIVPLAPR